jgi:hypothetical protein
MVSRGQIYVESKRYVQYSSDPSVASLLNTAGYVIVSVLCTVETWQCWVRCSHSCILFPEEIEVRGSFYRNTLNCSFAMRRRRLIWAMAQYFNPQTQCRFPVIAQTPLDFRLKGGGGNELRQRLSSRSSSPCTHTLYSYLLARTADHQNQT